MLHPKNDRIDYGEQLIPPNGYELKFAVGTTYTLDLEALLVLPVALFYSRLLDAKPNEIRYDMLDAITKSAEKIVVYCQKGKIHFPKEYHYLLAYWEKGIEEITMDYSAQSFHPKIWVIRYESADLPVKYRILVTSRNLTFSRDWDVAFSSNGEVGTENVKRTAPLIDFLHYLNKVGKREISGEFIEDLARVDFEVPDGFKLVNFFPIGINSNVDNTEYTNPLIKKKWDELMVLSPFVQDKAVGNLRENTSNNFWLLSRKEELDSLKNKTLSNIDGLFQFSKNIRDGELDDSLSEDGNETLMQNFHAKMFIGMRNDNPYWYLGSANASDPAFGRNVEFLIELKGDGYNQRPRTILNLLTSDKKAEIICFEPYRIGEKQDQTERKNSEIILRDIIYDLSTLVIRGTAKFNDQTSLFDLCIEINANRLTLPDGYTVGLKPLPARDRKSKFIEPGEVNIIKDFAGFTEPHLSSFILWEIFNKGNTEKQFVVQMLIELPNTRLGKIFTSIINSREKFLKYLTFLLAGDELEIISENNKTSPASNIKLSHSQWEIPGIPLFEKFMIASSRNPESLNSINNLLVKLKLEESLTEEKIITPEFESFWDTFFNYVEKSK